MKHFCRWLLRINGWKQYDTVSSFPDKFVLMIAPHTSMWDFVWGRLMLSAFGLNVRFLIKKEVFWFPLGLLLKALGGLPVNRSRGNDMVHQVMEELSRHKKLVIVITPEGTRAPVKRWKKGFYHIAVNAGMPIGVGYLDYKNLVYAIPRIVHPTGNFIADLSDILRVYQGKTGKHPDRFVMPEISDH